MLKIYKIFVLLFFVSFTLTAKAQVQPYEGIERVEFDIYRNNKHIGTHIFSFERSGNELAVRSEINIEIEMFGIVLYKYHLKGSEVYKDSKLIKFNSTTNHNGKNKYVNMLLENNKYIIDGSSYKGEASPEILIGTWWNHNLVQAKAQISAASGRIIKQKVRLLGKEIIKLGGKSYNTLHYNFSSDDTQLVKKKKLNTDIWYDEKTLNWVKASFDQIGKWEYRLVLVKELL